MTLISYLFEGRIEDLIRELIPNFRSLVRNIPHVLENGGEDEGGVLNESLLVLELLEEGLSDGFPGMSPKLVLPRSSGRGERQGFGNGSLGWGSEMLNRVLLECVGLFLEGISVTICVGSHETTTSVVSFE